MLTIQSNLKIQDLETLSKTLIKPDIINFGLNKVGGGYTDKIADKVIAKLSKLAKDKTIVIINDITLQMADKLLEAGYKNIYLAFGSFNEDGTVSKDKTVYNIMKAVIENNIKEKLNAISLEEIFTMKIKFDGIIANPPYGKIGANITKKIIDTVDFNEYINLLPANDYKRVDDLWNYQSNIEPIKDGFADAGVTTHVAKIHKNRINNLSKEHFDISTYDNDNLTKFFSQNINRTHYAIDAVPFTGLTIKNAGYWNVDNTFILHNRDQNHASMGYKKSFTWKWNVEKSVNFDDLISRKETNADNVQLTFCNIIFNTAVERNNFTEFMYHNHNFIRMIWTAMKVDMGIRPVGFPKVDWTRSWTVEEILKDYGYTQDKIEEVMKDLKNFKGMDD